MKGIATPLVNLNRACCFIHAGKTAARRTAAHLRGETSHFPGSIVSSFESLKQSRAKKN